MAQSAVDVCNGALQLVGATSILSLSDNTPEARQCAIAFDCSRRAELRKHRWIFATKRVQLSPDATAPLFDFLYQFTLPTDCLRILFPKDVTLDWVREGNKILTNAGPLLNLRYIADIEDATKWDTSFYEVLTLAVAHDICERLTTSTGKKATLTQDYEGALREARRNNAFEVLPAGSSDGSLLNVRN